MITPRTPEQSFQRMRPQSSYCEGFRRLGLRTRSKAVSVADSIQDSIIFGEALRIPLLERSNLTRGFVEVSDEFTKFCKRLPGGFASLRVSYEALDCSCVRIGIRIIQLSVSASSAPGRYH